MKANSYAAITAVFLAVLSAVGCNKSSQPKATALPSPSASPVSRMGAVVDNPTIALSDKSGRPVAQIAAESAAATGSNATDASGEMTKATATLYQKGKKVATLTADKLKADGNTRVLTAHGNVLVTSNDAPDEVKTLRADTVRWEYDTDKIIGNSNVVLQQGKLVRIPAANIVADTAIKTFDIRSDNSSITGSY